MDSLPTYKEARVIVDKAEIISEGTKHEFVRGCYSIRYRDAVLRLSMSWLSEDE